MFLTVFFFFTFYSVCWQLLLLLVPFACYVSRGQINWRLILYEECIVTIPGPQKIEFYH